MVKERIFKYLHRAGKGVEASQVLRDALNIHSPNARSADSVLAGFLKHDPRFVSTGGLWHLNPLFRAHGGQDLGQAVLLHVQSPNPSRILERIRGAIRWADGREQSEYLFVSPWGLCRPDSASLGRPTAKRLREKLESLFFTQGRGRGQRREIWGKAIVSRWFKSNQRRLNYLDVDEVADFGALLERLQHYLCDPDRLAGKVYYR